MGSDCISSCLSFYSGRFQLNIFHSLSCLVLAVVYLAPSGT